jgi:hypothetical protein
LHSSCYAVGSLLVSSLGRLACKGDEDMSPWLSEELALESTAYLGRRQ